MNASTRLPIGYRQENGTAEQVVVPLRTLRRHILVNGCTGWGKSGFLLSIILQLLRRKDTNITLVDLKGGTAHELTMFLASMTQRSPQTLCVIAPFKDACAPLNPLTPIPGLERDVQAIIVANLLTGLIDGIGQRMYGILLSLLRIVMVLNGSLLDVLRLLSDEPFVLQVAKLLSGELHHYLTTIFPSEPASSKDSLRSRLDIVLALPTVRAMLTTKGCITGSDLLERRLTIIDLSGAPMGFSSIGNFIGGWLYQLLCAGVFARPEQATPTTLCIDEWQELVRIGHEDLERVLSLARFKRVNMILANQTLAQISSVSPSLTQSVLTNVALRVNFRPEANDIKDLLGLLPITGQRINPHQPDRYLSQREEKDLLLNQLRRLPPRYALLGDREAGQAQIIRTLDLPYEEAARIYAALPTNVQQQWKQGTVAVTKHVLEQNPATIALPKKENQSTSGVSFSQQAIDTKTKPKKKTKPKLVLP